MNRIRIKAAAAAAITMVVCAGSVLFTGSSIAQEDIAEAAKAVKKSAPGEWTIDEKYRKLQEEYESVKADRDNLMVQARSLINERNRLQDMKTVTGPSDEETRKLQAQRDDFQKKALELEARSKEMEKSYADMEAENEALKISYGKIKSPTAVTEQLKEIKELNEKIAGLQKENQSLDSVSKPAKGKIEDLAKKEEKAQKQVAELSDKVAKLKKEVADAEKKNKAMERELKAIPEKFTELARQNKVLIKDTAQMHYNLGVFYTKKREYARAVAEFVKVIDINPDDAYAHFNLGYIYAEYMVDRKKAINEFRHYLRIAKGEDKDTDWVRNYLLTWEAYEGKQPME